MKLLSPWMMETTAMMVRTPMIIPRRVRSVLNLLAHKELIAMEIDSLILTFAIFAFLVASRVHYIRYVKGKERFCPA